MNRSSSARRSTRCVGEAEVHASERSPARAAGGHVTRETLVMRRTALVVAATLATVLLSAPAAGAHAEVREADPRAGGVAPTGLDELDLVFLSMDPREPIEVSVTDPAGDDGDERRGRRRRTDAERRPGVGCAPAARRRAAHGDVAGDVERRRRHLDRIVRVHGRGTGRQRHRGVAVVDRRARGAGGDLPATRSPSPPSGLSQSPASVSESASEPTTAKFSSSWTST